MDLLLHDSPFSMSLSTRAPPVHRTRFADLDRTCVLVVPSLSGRCRGCGLNESRHRWPSSRLPLLLTRGTGACSFDLAPLSTCRASAGVCSRSRTQTWLSRVLFFVELVPDSTALECFPCSVHSSRRCLQLATDRVLNGSTPTRVNATEASLDGRSFKICFLKPLASCSLTQCPSHHLIISLSRRIPLCPAFLQPSSFGPTRQSFSGMVALQAAMLSSPSMELPSIVLRDGASPRSQGPCTCGGCGSTEREVLGYGVSAHMCLALALVLPRFYQNVAG